MEELAYERPVRHPIPDEGTMTMQVLKPAGVNELNQQVAWHMDCKSHGDTCTCNTVTSNELVWTAWNATSTTSTIIDMDPTWRNWVSSTSATTATASYIWTSWVQDAILHKQLRRVDRGQNLPPRVVMTPEQIEAERVARRIEQERMAAEVKAANAAREIAKEKANKLLRSALSPKQLEELNSKGHFHCKSNKGHLYRIHVGTHGNVRRVEAGKEIESLCIQPDNVPTGDAMLAQKLMIETDEDTFRKIANISRLYN